MTVPDPLHDSDEPADLLREARAAALEAFNASLVPGAAPLAAAACPFPVGSRQAAAWVEELRMLVGDEADLALDRAWLRDMAGGIPQRPVLA